MLVLSRAVGEVICIGDDIAVHILEVNGHHVKVGVQAPAGGHVRRDEAHRTLLKRSLTSTQPDSNP
ncbi:carbon storage regulator [Pseudomonas sp. EYE_354]|uniref:carbon storage regulator n=1 Tax=Pseudomonas sp. EYE_354 TaxID=2853449 RepID=UPI002004B4F4|nr:carbon storage regulator [Pseudomonas sp. EYE_354]MCK6187408.1 carbon storage regulator [Pseudomonas sp. EYE_354]